ncbi:MAG: OmpA family protein [Planctomycetes bacterium]|nr:OmpA family protein [Planctomycetota bacterium]
MTMRLVNVRQGLMLGLLMLTAALAGCDDKVKAERDALYQQNQELQGELTTSRGALEAANSDRSRLESQVADLQGQMAAKPAPSKGAANPFGGIEGIDVTAGNGVITVRVPGDVLFESGKVDIKSTAKKTLGQIASVIKTQYPGKVVRVEGYTDSDPIKKSKWADNKELSAHRALAVERYLISQGLPDDKLYSAGFGEANPRSTKALSRRVEIVVVMN